MIKQFDKEIMQAINNYGDDKIDIAIQSDTVYAFYHSRHDSFPVTKNYSLSELGGREKLRIYEDDFNCLCICDME